MAQHSNNLLRLWSLSHTTKLFGIAQVRTFSVAVLPNYH
jgi:hypothetical protein